MRTEKIVMQQDEAEDSEEAEEKEIDLCEGRGNSSGSSAKVAEDFEILSTSCDYK